MSKYTGKTIIQIAQERGSAAKSRAGAWKFLLAHLPGPDKKRCSQSWEHDLWLDNRWVRRADGRARVLGYDPADPNTPGRAEERRRDIDRQTEYNRMLQVQRDSYGALRLVAATRSEEPRTEIGLLHAAEQLTAIAAAASLIERAYNIIEWDRRGRADGSAIHHEIYDIGVEAAVVCVRHTIGSKYGVSTAGKNYYLVERGEDGEISAQATTAPIAKLVKLNAPLGSIVAHVRGERTLSLAAPAVRGYKAVAVADDGALVSVWDGSLWAVGRPRIERARDDHEGGFYYYRDLDQLIMAARSKDIFGTKRSHHRLAIVEVEAAGRHIGYASGKYAASRITVLSQIGSLL